jgi:hypothetical protein
MIIGVYGKDASIRKNALVYIHGLGKVDALIYGSQNGSEELRKHAESSSLFGEVLVIRAENVLAEIEDNEERETILSFCQTSPHTIIFDELEEILEIKKLLEKHSDHFFDGTSEKKKSAFPSALCNALKRRDKKNAWVEYLRLKDEGEAEMLHGAILWQMRKLWEESISGSSMPYTCEELARKNKDLVVLVHEAHRGNCDLREGMEKWVLGL